MASSVTVRTVQPRFGLFEPLARRHARVPVWMELELAGLTPPDAYDRLAGPGSGFILEGVSPEPGASRYSYVCRDVESVVRTGPGEPDGQIDPVALLRGLLARMDVGRPPGLPPFFAGAAGYMAYEAARHFEPVVEPLPPDPIGCPEAAFLVPRDMVAFDRARNAVLVVALADCAALSAEAAYQDARRRVEHAVELLSSPAQSPSGDPARPSARAARGLRRIVAQSDYEGMVRDARGAIIAGELIQVVISQRFERETDAAPVSVYRELRALNPSPYMYLFDFGDFQIVGASPELLARVRDGVASIHPIAGTRPRGRTPAEDAALETELITSEKEQAEHVMLVDLVRNDLGRICLPGTVRVSNFLAVERYSHVMHLVSRVRGELAAGRDALDAFVAGFPAGTLTGAPKIRAMELIRDLEPEGRGPYCGGAGWFGVDGSLDSGTVIRSVVLKDGVAHIQGGGGIVFDSVPEAEYFESLHKAEAPLRAIDAAEAAAGGAPTHQEAALSVRISCPSERAMRRLGTLVAKPRADTYPRPANTEEASE